MLDLVAFEKITSIRFVAFIIKVNSIKITKGRNVLHEIPMPS